MRGDGNRAFASASDDDGGWLQNIYRRVTEIHHQKSQCHSSSRGGRGCCWLKINRTQVAAVWKEMKREKIRVNTIFSKWLSLFFLSLLLGADVYFFFYFFFEQGWLCFNTLEFTFFFCFYVVHFAFGDVHGDWAGGETSYRVPFRTCCCCCCFSLFRVLRFSNIQISCFHSRLMLMQSKVIHLLNWIGRDKDLFMQFGCLKNINSIEMVGCCTSNLI